MSPAKGQTDVNRISVSVASVFGMIWPILAVAGTVWTTEAGLRSDIRNLNTLMAAQSENAKLQRENDRLERAADAVKQQANIDQLKATIDSMEKTAPMPAAV